MSVRAFFKCLCFNRVRDWEVLEHCIGQCRWVWACIFNFRPRAVLT